MLTINKAIDTYLVDIDSIESDRPLPPVSEYKAKLVAQIGGFVKPMVVRELPHEGLQQKYQLVCGEEQLAIARWIYQQDDDFELVRCYVVNSDEDQAIAQELYQLS